MTRSLSFQWYGNSLLSCNSSLLIMGEWPHLRLAGTWERRILMLHSSIVFSMDEDITGTISCPPILRPSNFVTITGIWRFFFFFWRLWRFTPRINYLVVVWHASRPRVIFWLAKRSRFRWNLFRFPTLFKAKPFNPCLSPPISSFFPAFRFFYFTATPSSFVHFAL